MSAPTLRSRLWRGRAELGLDPELGFTAVLFIQTSYLDASHRSWANFRVGDQLDGIAVLSIQFYAD
jgi:hypothetical protein